MANPIDLIVNGKTYQVAADPETPLLYILRNDLGFKGVKYACGLEQCGACNVLIDGEAVPSCKLPVGKVGNAEIITIEGLGTPEDLHPLQEAFIEEQATQCGYCTSGIIVAAQGLLNKVRYPTDEQIDQALDEHLCRCGTHERIRRAIKLRIARPESDPLVETRDLPPLPDEEHILPNTLYEHPELDSWIRINLDETVTVFSGKVEYGQGIKTALTQIAADELDVALERIRMVMGDTDQTPNEGLTVGSMSLQTSGNAIRQAAAEARQLMLQLATEELEAWPADLIVEDGRVIDQRTGREISYWNIQAGKPFNHHIKGLAQTKTASSYRLIGKSASRVDLLAKVTGTHTYVHDLVKEGMLHGRVVRPPSYQAELKDVDAKLVEQMPGVAKVVRDGSFLGVVAEREEQASAAAAKLAETARWEIEPIASKQENLYKEIEDQIDESYLVVDGTATYDPIPPLEANPEAEKTISAVYTKPYHMHATIAPSAALASFKDGNLTVWTHSQGVFPPRENLAKVLRLPLERIHLIHVESSGNYGHNGSDDAALDAALLARAVPGRPVLLKWTRAQEHQWEPYQPPALIKMQASLDRTGRVLNWSHDLYSPPHLGRGRADENTSGLLAAWYLEDPMPKPPLAAGMWNNGGAHRNADPIYNFEPKRIIKRVQLKPALRTSSFRGLGAFANIFALESFVDELADAAGIDPVEFRLNHLNDNRAATVIKAAADKAGWSDPPPPDHGRGIAFARYKNSAAYCAVVVKLSVDRKNGKIQLKHAVIAGEAGQVVNPDGLSNQLEGGFIQAASMTLKEQVDYGPEGIHSIDWESYPILTFSEAPRIETVILNRPDAPFLGGGEASLGPTSAAISNAVFSAVGIRLRQIPFLPVQVKTAIGK
jgi:nicotinate dehydrogenase subunit B